MFVSILDVSIVMMKIIRWCKNDNVGSRSVSCFLGLYVVISMYPAAIKATPFQCHDDPSFEVIPGILREVQFTWLAGLQYIHMQTGHPNYYRVPRVVMVHRRFVLSTAQDAANLPDDYALGNVIFGDYERDEAECGITPLQLIAGESCEPTVLVVPIADVLLHPEFKHFHVRNSIALIKLVEEVTSQYMLPICLPYMDYTSEEYEKELNDTVEYFHIDFYQVTPLDLPNEDKVITMIQLVPKEKCHMLDERLDNHSDPRIACSSTCDHRSGAPTFLQTNTGRWTLVALAHGKVECGDPWFKPRMNHPPSTHTLIYPYVSWITQAISVRAFERSPTFRRNDPFGIGTVVAPRGYVGLYDIKEKGWVGKWWIAGLSCYDSGSNAANYFRFYHEVFQIIPNGLSEVNYYIELHAPPDVDIICVKVGFPFRMGSPKLWGLMQREVRIRIKIFRFTISYRFDVEAYGIVVDRTKSPPH